MSTSAPVQAAITPQLVMSSFHRPVPQAAAKPSKQTEKWPWHGRPGDGGNCSFPGGGEGTAPFPGGPGRESFVEFILFFLVPKCSMKEQFPHTQCSLAVSDTLLPLEQVSRHVVVTTDASRMGWGTVCNERAALGSWTGPWLQWRINCLELLAVLLARLSTCVAFPLVSPYTEISAPHVVIPFGWSLVCSFHRMISLLVNLCLPLDRVASVQFLH